MRQRARFSVGLATMVVVAIGGLGWQTLGLGAATRSDHGRVRARRHPVARPARLLSLCTSGLETISPCATSATVYVHGGGTTVFEIDNNSSFDDILDLSCTKPGVVSACSVTPAIDTVKAGRSKQVTLSFTAGAAGGTGVILVDAFGNATLEATDTIKVNRATTFNGYTLTYDNAGNLNAQVEDRV